MRIALKTRYGIIPLNCLFPGDTFTIGGTLFMKALDKLSGEPVLVDLKAGTVHFYTDDGLKDWIHEKTEVVSVPTKVVMDE